MDTETLITLLRTEIEKSGHKCYSPDLPHNDEICSAISLRQGTNQKTINQNILYSEIPFYVLVRGTTNDKETRRLVDSIFNLLDMKENVSLDNITATLITCYTPNYAFRDENQRIHYNINCFVRVERNEEEGTKVQ